MTRLVSALLLSAIGVMASAQVPTWTRDFNSGARVNDNAVTIGVDDAGNVYSAGTRGAAPNRDIIVVSYSPTGALRWAQAYNGTGKKDDIPVEISVDKNGDVYLVGMSFRDATNNAMITQKYAGGTGSIQWTEAHYFDDGMSGLLPCTAKGIALGPEGLLYACGSAPAFNEFEDAYVVSQNRMTGAISNTHVFRTGLSPASNQSAVDIAFNGTDGVFVTGPTADNVAPNSSDASDMFVRRLTTTLEEVWTNTYDGFGMRDIPRNIAVKNNDVFVFGNATTNPATYPVLFTVKANATGGTEVWRKMRPTASDVETGKMLVMHEMLDALWRGSYVDTFGNPNIIANMNMTGGIAYRYRGTDGYVYWERMLDSQYVDLAVEGGAATYLVGANTMKLSTSGATLWAVPQAGVSAAIAPGKVLYTNGTQFNADADLRTTRWFQSFTLLTISPQVTQGGVNVTGTIKSNLQAPVGGLRFNLSEDSIYVAVPATVTMPAGATHVDFTIYTAPLRGHVNVYVPITASLNGVSLVQTLTLVPPVPQSVVMAPGVVQGGNPSTGTVTLTGKTPAAGLWVALLDNSTFVTTPPAVKVLANQTSANFDVTTTAVVTTQVVTISAKSNGVTTTTTLTVNP